MEWPRFFSTSDESSVLRLSIAATLLIAVAGLLFGLVSGSFSIVFDGVYSLVDASMSAVALAVVRLITSYAVNVDLPRKWRERFTMGFWHLEPMVLGLNGTLLVGVAVYALINGVTSLLSGGHALRFGSALVYAALTVSACVAMAVIENPYAGRYAESLDELIAIGEELGGLLGSRCVEALGIAPDQAQSYGKAAIVGEAGELEHAAAILHPKLGAPLRKAVGKGAALVPSSKKQGGIGTAVDVPLGHKDAAFVRSHFDAMEARVADAPRANEIVVAVVVTDSGRPLPRVGGLQSHEIKGEDGLR